MELQNEMNFLEKKRSLINIVENEFNRFINGVKEKSAQEIIDSAYEIVIKDDIKELIISDKFSHECVEILLTIQKPIDCIYTNWLANDYGLIDAIDETIRDVVNEREVQILYEKSDKTDEVSTNFVYEYTAIYEQNDDNGIEL